jgi:hypothetical protein
VIRFLRRDAKSPTPKGAAVPPVDVAPPPDRTPSLAPEAALAQADELYAQGDAIEAIALLTAANARARPPHRAASRHHAVRRSRRALAADATGGSRRSMICPPAVIRDRPGRPRRR